MRRVIVNAGLGSAVLAVSLAAIAPTFGPAGAQVVSDEKVSYCHATADVTNPYTLLTTAVASIIQQGHHLHLGPVFPDGGRRGGWGDIIPPFDYFGGSFPGLNFPRGFDVLKAGCKVNITPAPPETTTTAATTTTSTTTTTTEPTTTTTEPTTTTTEPATTTTESTTTTTEPTSPTTGTTAPESTTTTLGQGENVPTTTLAPGATTVPESTTTTAATTASTTPPTTAPASQWPPAPTLPPGGGELPPLQAVVVTPGPILVILGLLSPEQRAEVRAVLIQRLAQTGTNESGVVLVGISTVLIGSAAVVLAAWRRKPSRRPSR